MVGSEIFQRQNDFIHSDTRSCRLNTPGFHKWRKLHSKQRRHKQLHQSRTKTHGTMQGLQRNRFVPALPRNGFEFHGQEQVQSLRRTRTLYIVRRNRQGASVNFLQRRHIVTTRQKPYKPQKPQRKLYLGRQLFRSKKKLRLR